MTFFNLAYGVKIDDIMSACKTSSELPPFDVRYKLKQASEPDVIRVLSNTSTRRKIFPDNMCIVNFEPFDAVVGNASMMLRSYNCVFFGLDSEGNYDSLSIMSYDIDVPAGCVFVIDYYGPHYTTTVIQHVRKHLQQVNSVYTKGRVSIGVTTSNTIKYHDLCNAAAIFKLKPVSLSEKIYTLEQPIPYIVQWILTKACFAVWTMFYDWFWYYGVSRAEISRVPLWHPWAEFFKGKNKMAARYFKVKYVFFNKWSQEQV